MTQVQRFLTPMVRHQRVGVVVYERSNNTQTSYSRSTMKCHFTAYV
ncbi:unnamed protein product [Schistosoma curassoni]|uniref:Recombinase family protein n=1 Tax=Schistosoma curassoni TaxID=6186 RepID=A0A183JRV2_9TREM|nr:unnamed protein product [Schistosoma curassoni]